MLYLDTSALLKTVRREAESASLRDFLRQHRPMDTVCSALTTTEMHRAVGIAVEREGLPDDLRRRYAEAVRLRLRSIRLVAVTQGLLDRASGLHPVLLRTLDAIHLATALQFGDELAAFVTYDHRLAQAAAANGVQVAAPGAELGASG